MKFVYFCVSLTFGLAMGCQPSQSNLFRDINNVGKSFPGIDSVDFQKKFTFDQSDVRDLWLVDDSIILIHTQSRVPENFLYMLDRSTNTLVDTILTYGRGPKEAIGLSDSGIFGDSIWGRDPTKQVIYKFPANIFLSNRNDTLIQDYKINRHYYNLVAVNDRILLGSSPIYNNDSSDIGYLFEAYDYKSQSITMKFGKILSNGKIPIGSLVDTHGNVLAVNPKGTKVAAAYLFKDALEIFDVASGEKLSDYGGGMIDEIPFEVGDSEGHAYMRMVEENKRTYVIAKATNEYIYLMYSGEHFFDEGSHLGNEIHVFDWNGEPVKKIALPFRIQAFVVGSSEEILVCDEFGKFYEGVIRF